MGRTESRIFLEDAGYNFLIQDEPTKSDTQLDLLFTNNQELCLDVINVSLGYIDSEIAEFEILRKMRMESSRVKTPQGQ